MEYRRRNISLPLNLDTRVGKEKNSSGTVADALNLYYNSKDSVKRLTELVKEFEANFDYLDDHLTEIKKDVKDIKELLNSRGGY